MTYSSRPLHSLQAGHWFKLICGASFQHLPAIRTLVLAYTLAGADCIDISADPAVVLAVREALKAAEQLHHTIELGAPWQGLPWLMVSLNAGEDPHFRKAAFDPEACPPDCPQPCVAICPAQAIAFQPSNAGVLTERCYGCGRCLPICPQQLITTQAHGATPEMIAPLISAGTIDAVEIHTQVGHLAEFAQLWQAIAPYTDRLKLLAISCPDGEDLLDYLWTLYKLVSPLGCPLVWQTDGRPMSGDIGDGATRATLKLGQKVLQAGLPGFVQLAGGTNDHTVTKLRTAGLLNSQVLDHPSSDADRPFIAGVAYGSFARRLLLPVQEQLERHPPFQPLEAVPQLLQQAVLLAQSLVSPLKSPLPLMCR